jgi:hypothetical protein
MRRPVRGGRQILDKFFEANPDFFGRKLKEMLFPLWVAIKRHRLYEMAIKQG